MDLTHTLRGINIVGLRRAGFDTATIRALQGHLQDSVRYASESQNWHWRDFSSSGPHPAAVEEMIMLFNRHRRARRTVALAQTATRACSRE